MPVDTINSIGLFTWGAIGPFLLTMARLGLALTFVPLPGLKAAPDLARIAIITMLAATVSQAVPFGPLPQSAGVFALVLVGEVVYGLAVGLVVAFMNEVLTFAVQAFALQAGYAYASSIDPNSEADSTVLMIFAQLMSGVLFFSLGGHRLVIRAFAKSLELWPAGGVAATTVWAEMLSKYGSSMLELSIRLALPVAGLLLLAEIALGVVSRLQSQMQLLSLAFPLKMLGSLATLAILAPLWVHIYQRAFESGTHLIERMLAR